MAEEPIVKKAYYSIGDVCELTGLKPHVLRYWETQFTSLSPAKNQAGKSCLSSERRGAHPPLEATPIRREIHDRGRQQKSSGGEKGWESRQRATDSRGARHPVWNEGGARAAERRA